MGVGPAVVLDVCGGMLHTFGNPGRRRLSLMVQRLKKLAQSFVRWSSRQDLGIVPNAMSESAIQVQTFA